MYVRHSRAVPRHIEMCAGFVQMYFVNMLPKQILGRVREGAETVRLRVDVPEEGVDVACLLVCQADGTDM